MTTSHSALTVQTPWAIALLRLPSGCQPYAVSRRDMERDTEWALKVFAWMDLQKGLPIQLIGAGSDNATLWPFENACIRRGIPFGMAEPVQIDAGRSDMFLRRFHMQAAIGLAGGVLDGLQAAGRDLKKLLGEVPVLAAMSDACERLEAAGLKPWRMVQVGPIYAFESPDGGGARYDNSEWLVEDDGTQLLLTSLAPRACPFVRLKTGVRARVDTATVDGKTERLIKLP